MLLPIGDHAFVADRAAYTLNGAASWSLPYGIGLTAFAGGALNPAGGHGYNLDGNLVGSVSHTLTEGVAGYAEGAWFPVQGGDNPAYVGGGVTALLTRIMQADGFVDHVSRVQRVTGSLV